jgi:hypothetical protein
MTKTEQEKDKVAKEIRDGEMKATSKEEDREEQKERRGQQA